MNASALSCRWVSPASDECARERNRAQRCFPSLDVSRPEAILRYLDACRADLRPRAPLRGLSVAPQNSFPAFAAPPDCQSYVVGGAWNTCESSVREVPTRASRISQVGFGELASFSVRRRSWLSTPQPQLRGTENTVSSNLLQRWVRCPDLVHPDAHLTVQINVTVVTPFPLTVNETRLHLFAGPGGATINTCSGSAA